MASKTNKAVAQAAPTEVAVTGYETFGGKGWDNVTQADIAMAFLNQLQDSSPECKKSSAKKIPGAEAGFFMNSVTKELYGDQGVIIVPVLTENKLVEWVPRKKDVEGGGGFVGTHPINGDVHQKAIAANAGNKFGISSEAGNDLVDTFYMYAMILDTEDAVTPANNGVMIPFAKTKWAGYRAGMGRINTVKGSVNLPLFANRLRLTSVAAMGAAGDDYFKIDLSPIITGKATDADNVIASRISPMLGDSPHPLLVAGQSLYEALVSGVVKKDYGQGDNEGDGGKTVKTDKHF